MSDLKKRVETSCLESRVLVEEAVEARKQAAETVVQTRRVVVECRDVLLFDLKPHLWKVFTVGGD